MRILFLKVLKNRDSYQVLVIDLSSEVLDTKPVRYGLHQSFTDKNKFVKRNVSVELEALAASLDHYVQQSDKETFQECLCSSTNITTRKIYTDQITLLHHYINSNSTVTFFQTLYNSEVFIQTNKGNTGYSRKYINEILYQ